MYKHKIRHLIAVNFILAPVIGTASSDMDPCDPQKLFWGISAFFIIIGATLLASKLSRTDHDIPDAWCFILHAL